jgi:urease accessory protein UreE
MNYEHAGAADQAAPAVFCGDGALVPAFDTVVLELFDAFGIEQRSKTSERKPAQRAADGSHRRKPGV